MQWMNSDYKVDKINARWIRSKCQTSGNVWSTSKNKAQGLQDGMTINHMKYLI